MAFLYCHMMLCHRLIALDIPSLDILAWYCFDASVFTVTVLMC